MEKEALTILKEKKEELHSYINALSIAIDLLQKDEITSTKMRFKDFKPLLISFMSIPRSWKELKYFANQHKYLSNLDYVKKMLVKIDNKYILK